MKHNKFYIVLGAIAGLFIGISSIAYATTVFNSNQVGTSPTNGYVLQTNGSLSTWVATSTLGISGGSGGSGNVATSSSETSGYFPTWTSTNGTPALLSGTSQLFQSAGNLIGIATTSPFAQLSINPSGIGTGPIFVIGSSTATQLTIDNKGNTTWGSGIFVQTGAPTSVTGASGTLRISNDTSGNLRPGIVSTGNGTSFATYGNGGNSNNGSSFQTSALMQFLSVGSQTVGSGNFLTSPTVQAGIFAALAANVGLVVRGATSQTADLQEWQSTGGPVLDTVTSTGNVGIASSTPFMPLSVTGGFDFTNPGSPGSVIGSNVLQTNTFGLSPSNTTDNLWIATTTTSANINVRAMTLSLDYEGAATAGGLRALNVASAWGVNTTGNNTVTTATQNAGLAGGIYQGQNSSIGRNVAFAIGLGGLVVVNGTTASTTDAAAIEAQSPTVTTGNLLTNYRGLWARSLAITGTVTNWSGIDVSSVTRATNNTDILFGADTNSTGNFGLYQGDTLTNYLQGNTGIGTTTPDSKLDVNGNVRFEGTSSFVTAAIGGAIVSGGCDSVTTTGLDATMSSTTAFVTTPQGDPGATLGGTWAYSFVSTPGSVITRVCSNVTVTPNSVPYVVKIIR